jgi:D-aminopeptidase
MSEEAVNTETPEQVKLNGLDKLFESFNRSDAPGLVVGVAKDGKAVYRKAFGMASLELGVANTPQTRMRIGSTSKQFAAFAALLLVEDGKLDLDVSVRQYIPEFPSSAGPITLRDFMTHTSGHRCGIDLGFLAEGMAVRPMGFTLATMIRQTEPNFERGEKFIYNNGGFHLLSVAIERASGMTFERFLEERIFQPLGMNDTNSVPSDLQLTRGMAGLHVRKPDGGWRRGIFPSDEIRGEGAIISTVDDMLRWVAHMRAPAKLIGTPESWRQLLSPAKLRNGFVLPYCLGIMKHRYRGVEVMHHPGGVIGGLCQLLTVPEHALDIIVMLNSDAANPAELANKVVDVELAELLGPVDAVLEPGQFKSVIGQSYVCARSGLVARFEDVAGKLGLALLNAPPIALHDGEKYLRLAAEEIAVGPFLIEKADVADKEEPPSRLQILEGEVQLDFALVPDTRPETAVAGASLTGRYRCADIGGSATIGFDGENLVMHITGTVARNTLILKPLTLDLFEWTCPANTQVPMAGVLLAERDATGVRNLRINTWRTRDLRFERNDA